MTDEETRPDRERQLRRLARHDVLLSLVSTTTAAAAIGLIAGGVQLASAVGLEVAGAVLAAVLATIATVFATAQLRQAHRAERLARNRQVELRSLMEQMERTLAQTERWKDDAQMNELLRRMEEKLRSVQEAEKGSEEKR